MKINQDFCMSVQIIFFLKERNTSEFLQAGEIAKALNFSVGYLQKVVQTLGKYGIVECKRGRIGGDKGQIRNDHFIGFYGRQPVAILILPSPRWSS